jgi:hypothetical protein
MAADGRTPPEGRMAWSALLGLFFAGFAFGSLHTAKQEYRWRNATVVRGVLVKKGSTYHYEYRPASKPAVIGMNLGDQSSNLPDGVVDDWARLEYDPKLPEQLRRHQSKGRAPTNYGQFLITATAGGGFAIAVLGCVWAFLKAWYDKTHASEEWP